MDIEQMRIRMGEMAAEIERLHERLIQTSADRNLLQGALDDLDAARQSPTVAVKICDECDIENCKHVKNKTLQIIANASPSITEQDAREIAVAATSLIGKGFERMVDAWIDRPEGRALLTKLNAKPESVGG